MRACRTVQFGVALLLVWTASAADSRETHLDAGKLAVLEDFLKKQMEIDRIPGLSIGYYSGEYTWAKGYGYADLENRTPASARSAYRLASNTKSMTAVAILQLAEQGKLSLDDEVHKYVPYFPWKHWPISIRQLLGHLGGISHYRDYDVEGHIKEHKYTRGAIAIFAPFDLVAQPGTRYNYSSYGYNLLGAVIEGATRKPYGEFLREHLWQPLGMNDTQMDDPDSLIPNRVRGYRLIFGKVVNSEFVDISSRFAAGGTRSTVPDLLKYAKGLAAGTVLSKQSIRLMETSMATADSHFTDYGMGWRLVPVNGHFVAYHTGGQPETRTLLVRFPTLDFAIALAYNLEGADLFVYARRLYQLLLDEGWNMPAYAGNQVGETLYRGLWETYNFGLAHYDRYGRPLSRDAEELARAFTYFNSCMNPDSLRLAFQRASEKIRVGRHPLAGQAFVKIGSFMAAKLVEGADAGRKDHYHKQGALPLFADYIRLYRQDPSIDKSLQFNPELEETILKWEKDWQRTWDEKTRRLHIAAYEDLTSICTDLLDRFRGAGIYPYFGADLARAVRDLCAQHRLQEAVRVADATVELYPEAAESYLTAAIPRVLRNEMNAARERLKRAQAAKVRKSTISSAALDRIAERLFSANHLNQALDFLELAEELYPDEARFHDTRAEIYLELSRRESREALRKDPTLEAPWKRLKKID